MKTTFKKLGMASLVLSILFLLLPLLAIKAQEVPQETPPPEITAPPSPEPLPSQAPEAPAPQEQPTLPPAEQTPTPPPSPETPTPPPPPAEEKPAEVTQGENVTQEDLGVKKVGMLPDNPFYFVKNVGRGLKQMFTFNPVKKAEVQLEIANQKVLEAEALSEKEGKEEIAVKAIENFQKEIEKVSDRVEKIKDKAENNETVNKLADKITDSQIKQQKVLEKVGETLEEKLPEDMAQQMMERMEKVKDVVSQKNMENLTKLEDVDKIPERIARVVEEQRGGDFKQFKALEVLKGIENRLPEQAKEAIQGAQENIAGKFGERMKMMGENEAKKFNQYVQDMGGNEIRHMEIINNLEMKEMPQIIREEMEKAKITAIDKMEKKMMGFKNDNQKAIYMKGMESGGMENLRIFNELENNLSPEVANKLTEIKNKAMDNFRKDFEQAASPDKFMESLEKFHDVKQMEVFKEIEQIIPENKKADFEKLKTQAISAMEKDIAQAKNMEEKRMKFEKLAGDNPEGMEIMKEFGPPPEIMNEIMKEQVEKLSRKIENTQDAEKLAILKQRIEEEDATRQEIQNRNPEIFKNIEEKEDDFMEEMTKEKAEAQIAKAEAELVLAKQEYASADQEFIKLSPAAKLLEVSKKHIEKAKLALTQEFNEGAFGQATAALHEANSVRRIIKEAAFRKEIDQKRQQERGQMGPPPEGMMPQQGIQQPQGVTPPQGYEGEQNYPQGTAPSQGPTQQYQYPPSEGSTGAPAGNLPQDFQQYGPPQQITPPTEMQKQEGNNYPQYQYPTGSQSPQGVQQPQEYQKPPEGMQPSQESQQPPEGFQPPQEMPAPPGSILQTIIRFFGKIFGKK